MRESNVQTKLEMHAKIPRLGPMQLGHLDKSKLQKTKILEKILRVTLITMTLEKFKQPVYIHITHREHFKISQSTQKYLGGVPPPFTSHNRAFIT